MALPMVNCVCLNAPREMEMREEELRAGGWDPEVVGHRLVDGSQFDYQDSLIRFLVDAVRSLPSSGVLFEAILASIPS